MIYNYELQRDEQQFTTDFTAVILIIITGAVLLLWWASQAFTPQFSVRTMRQICLDQNSTEMLAEQSILQPYNITHAHLIGEFTIGWLTFAKIYNHSNEPIYCIALANDDYSTTTVRQRFNCPIISISREFSDMKSASDFLKPSERTTFENALKRIEKMKAMNPELAEYIEKKAERDIEKEGESYD